MIERYIHPNLRGLCISVLVLPLTLMLVSCSGGSGGDTITLTGSSDQSPDPVVVEVPIAYIKRPVPPVDADPVDPPDLREPSGFLPGAQLLVRSRASSSAAEIDITPQIVAIVTEELALEVDPDDPDAPLLAIDIKGLEVSFDGAVLIFAARAVPEPVDNNLDETTWNLWQYDFETGTASYVIGSQAIRNEAAEDGSSQDTSPHFLPDGRIVFSSTRQTGSLVRLTAENRPAFISADEDRRGPATLLHIFDPDDGGFRQITFNPSHDIDPAVLTTGEIVFTRWDNGPGHDGWNLYKINPSGRQHSLLYGFHSHDTGSDPTTDIQFTQPRTMDDGRLLTILRPTQTNTLGGEIVLIDINGYVEHDQTIWADQAAGSTTDAQQPLTDTEILIDDPLSPGGQFSAAYPLQDGTGRILVVWNQCRASEQDITDPTLAPEDIIIQPCSIAPVGALPVNPLYGLWIFDPSEGTQLPIIPAQEGFYYTEIVAAESRLFPPVPDDAGIEVFNSDLVDPLSTDEGFALLQIDSVYDFDGQDLSADGIATLANPANAEYRTRPARFIRIVKPVPLPDPDNDNFDIPNTAFGLAGNQRMREVVGYVPVEPDGSVTALVPANTPFMISVLDDRARRLGPRHNVWMQLGAGEIRRCGGCHTDDSELPHGRIDSEAPTSNAGAVSLTVGSGTGIGFPNTKANRNDYPILFLDAMDIGDTMAEIYGQNRPLGGPSRAVRDLELELVYIDEWADTVNGRTPDISLDYTYEAGWTAYPNVTSSAAPYANRLVINYPEHIQPIWERARTMAISGVQVNDPNAVPAVSCLSCHTSNLADPTSPNEVDIPAGQLDLGSQIDSTFYRSYSELFLTDTERWLDNAGNAANRVRTCTQPDGMGGTQTIADPSPATIPGILRSAGANSSPAFFRCFEDGGGNCGVFNQQAAASANCVEDGTIVTDPVLYNHDGWLNPGELRLISEWLDIGGQYYNDPFNPDVEDL